MNQQTEVLFYHYLLSRPDLAYKISPKYFNSENIKELYNLGRDYTVKYHVAPSKDQMKELILINKKSDTVSNDIIDIIYAQQDRLNQYTEEWLYDSITSWATWEQFSLSLVDTVSYIKMHEDEVDTENVKEICETAKGMFNRNAILDFDPDTAGSDFFNVACHRETKLKKQSTGINYIDKCLNGGTWAGSLLGIAGAPKIGKSLWLQNLCAEAVKAGRNCMYVSLELPEEMIIQRIGANLLSINSLEYSRIAEDENAMKQRMNAFRSSLLNAPGSLYVRSFPTSMLTTIELESFLLKREEELSTESSKFKFDLVFLDYINIMKNYRNPNSENTYQKIKSLAEDCRAIAVKNNWCMWTATQTNRSQFDTTDMTANQISESAGFGATVDALFGIVADPIMKANHIYYLKCLYDRVCPMDNTRKKFNLHPEYLRITEDMTTSIEDAEEILKNTNVKSIKESQENYNNQNNYSNQPQIGGTFTLNNSSQVASTNAFTTMDNITGMGLF